MAKFSIILPVRNGGHYVKECVNSVLAQTLNDFTLQVLDNYSTDGTLEWLRTLADKRIKIYPAEKSLSIEENWGRVVSVQKNEYITLIGHDDILANNYLEVMNGLILKHPRASLYQTHFSYIDAGGKQIRRCIPMDEIQSAPEFLSFLLTNSINIMGTGFMMRAADYDALGGIQPYPNLLFADFELWLNMTLIGFKATAFEECFSFRLHQSMTTTSKDIQLQKSFGKFIDYLQRLKMEQPQLQEVIKRYAVDYILFYCKSLSHRLLRTPKRNRESLTVDQFIEQCKKWADDLVPDNHFRPFEVFTIKLARQIDSNAISRRLFVLFKSIYSKPIYN